jgi:chromosome segregation ATPase
MQPATLSLVIGLLTFLGGLISLYYSRRTPDAFARSQETLTKLQERNDKLYEENVAYQTQVTDLTRSKEQLSARIEERERQLSTNSRQLDLLREMAKTAPITDALQEQIVSMNQIITNLQQSQVELQQLLKSRDSAYQELFHSTHDILKVKPGVK